MEFIELPRTTENTRIIPRHFHLAVHNDEELNKLLGVVTISQGEGVLLPKKTVSHKAAKAK